MNQNRNRVLKTFLSLGQMFPRALNWRVEKKTCKLDVIIVRRNFSVFISLCHKTGKSSFSIKNHFTFTRSEISRCLKSLVSRKLRCVAEARNICVKVQRGKTWNYVYFFISLESAVFFGSQRDIFTFFIHKFHYIAEDEDRSDDDADDVSFHFSLFLPAAYTVQVHPQKIYA